MVGFWGVAGVKGFRFKILGFKGLGFRGRMYRVRANVFFALGLRSDLNPKS